MPSDSRWESPKNPIETLRVPHGQFWQSDALLPAPWGEPALPARFHQSFTLTGQDLSPYLPVLQQSLWFAGLPQRAVQRLLDGAVLRHLGPGQLLFLRGDKFDGIYCVLAGEIRLSGLTPDGQDNMLSLVAPPLWFGEIALFDDLPRTHDAHAVGPTLLLHLTQTHLEAMLQDDPQWAFRFGAMLAQKTRALLFIVDMQSRLDTQAKLARCIVMTATQGWSSTTNHFDGSLRLNQGTLAESLSVTRQTVALGLKRLQEQGILKLSYRRVAVLDWARLCAVAEVDAQYPPAPFESGIQPR